MNIPSDDSLGFIFKASLAAVLKRHSVLLQHD